MSDKILSKSIPIAFNLGIKLWNIFINSNFPRIMDLTIKYLWCMSYSFKQGPWSGSGIEAFFRFIIDFPGSGLKKKKKKLYGSYMGFIYNGDWKCCDEKKITKKINIFLPIKSLLDMLYNLTNNVFPFANWLLDLLLWLFCVVVCNAELVPNATNGNLNFKLKKFIFQICLEMVWGKRIEYKNEIRPFFSQCFRPFFLELIKSDESLFLFIGTVFGVSAY